MREVRLIGLEGEQLGIKPLSYHADEDQSMAHQERTTLPEDQNQFELPNGFAVPRHRLMC